MRASMNRPIATWCSTVLAFLLLGPSPDLYAGDVIFDTGFDESAEGPFNDAEASRFLQQATFGPNLAEIKRLRAMGYNAWLNEQFNAATSNHFSYLQYLDTVELDINESHRHETWFQRAMTAPDQLRQRMAFALSQIFVVSEQNSNTSSPWVLADYNDMLLRNSFGSYRTLLGDVTRSPAMGVYLSMMGNQKPNIAQNIRPDENYAREIMQLFSIGLYQLNADGTRQLNGGNPIPTYNQDVIRNMAHVFTGWNWWNCTNQTFQWCWYGEDGAGWTQNMAPFENYHDRASKTIFNGIVLPANVDANPELNATLDHLNNHANVGPFLARRLIQRFTSSTPSPAYVQRVSNAFNNNGSGVRGDFKAVLRAILLDPEARSLQATSSHRGKLREPLLRRLALWRALDARSVDGRYREWWPEWWSAQTPLGAPSVFNFYLPDYQVPGEMTTLGVYAPEFQIVTDSTITRFANDIAGVVMNDYRPRDPGAPAVADDVVTVDIAPLITMAHDARALIDRLDVLFTGYQLSDATRTVLINHLNSMPIATHANRRERVQDALFVLLNSPEYVIGR